MGEITGQAKWKLEEERVTLEEEAPGLGVYRGYSTRRTQGGGDIFLCQKEGPGQLGIESEGFVKP